ALRGVGPGQDPKRDGLRVAALVGRYAAGTRLGSSARDAARRAGRVKKRTKRFVDWVVDGADARSVGRLRDGRRGDIEGETECDSGTWSSRRWPAWLCWAAPPPAPGRPRIGASKATNSRHRKRSKFPVGRGR